MTGTATQGISSAIAGLVMLGIIAFIVIGGTLALLRWIFRIDRIVKRLDQLAAYQGWPDAMNDAQKTVGRNVQMPHV